VFTLGYVVLGLLVAAAALGVVNLARWLGHGRSSLPAGKAATHIALVVGAIVLWVTFLATGRTLLAWTTFVVITVGQVFGDVLMFASYRARSGVTGKVAYGAAAKDVMGFKRPFATLHATAAALGYFLLLATAIWASID